MFDSEFLDNLEPIVTDVRENGGVLTVPMRRLKEMHGAMRLKSLVRQSIKDHLSFKQIGVVGGELPGDENASVRLYLKGTPVARIIETVELQGARGDQELRKLANNGAGPSIDDLIKKLKLVIEQFDETEESDG